MECLSGLCGGFPQRRRESLDGAARRAEARAGRPPSAGRVCRPPRQFSDDYTVGRKVLGVGRNGAVLQARCRRTGAVVAVKTLDLRGASAGRLRAAEAEAEISLRLDHPHVVRLLDVYETADCVQLVMERLGGGELFHRLQRAQRFSEQDAAYAVWQMLVVVNYLHAHGVVHRDLKLENFLYEREDSDHLKLIDFSASSLQKPGGRMTELAGTLAYAAPEVLAQNYTSQCDLWSLGVITFALLTGHMPFDGSDEEVAERIRAGRFADEPCLWRGLSASSRHFVRSLLSVDPSARLTAQQALQHPWLAARERAPPRGCLDVGVAAALGKFAREPRLRRALLRVMAWSLTCEEREQVRQAFLEMDSSRRGCVGPEDLAAALGEKLRAAGGGPGRAPEAFSVTCPGDAGHKGTDGCSGTTWGQEISYSTFLAAMLPARIGPRDELMGATFRALDAGGRGRVTAADLQRALGEPLSAAELEELQLCGEGVSDDGSITCEQFSHYMKEAWYEPPTCTGA